MKRWLGQDEFLTTPAGPRLRCFLRNAFFLAIFSLAAVGLSWATVEGPGPLHVWRLHGFYVNATGSPIAGIEVTLVRDGRVFYKTRTDGSGRFAFQHVSGRYFLSIDKAGDRSQLSREVIVGLETATALRGNTIYVIAGPGACSDDCSAVYTSKSDFEKAVRRNAEGRR